MKKGLLISTGIVVVLAGAALVAPNFVDWNSYKDQALSQAKTMSGLDVKINGDISMAILPSPRVYIEDVVVADPKGGDKPLVALKMLDVRVALMPLLSGHVVVNSFNLKDPQVNLSKNAEGRFNYQTPELDAMMAKKPDSGQAGQKQPVSVVFENINIENGQLSFKDAAAKAPVEIADLDLALKADTLSGPFDASGSMVYGGSAVKFDAKTGQMDAQTQSTSLNLKAVYADLNVTYAGVVTGGAAPEAQGEISVSASSLSDVMVKAGMAPNAMLAGAFKAEGALSANAQQVSLKNASIALAGQSLDGQVTVGLAPLSVDGAFSSDKPIDFDQIMAQSGVGAGAGASAQKGGDLTDLAASLPKTLELPATGPIKFALSMPSAVYNKQIIKDVTLSLSKQEKGFAIDFAAGEIPGGGAVKGNAALSYAEKSKSEKAGTEIYSGASARFSVRGKSSNAPETVKAFSGLSGLPLIKDSRTALFDISGQVVQNGLALDKGVINLDDKAFALSGSLKKQKDSARSLANIKVVADSLDFDELSGADQKASAAPSADPLAPLKTLALPYDVDADVSVTHAMLQGYQIEGLRAAATILPNSIVLRDVGAKNFAGSEVSVSGKISDLKNLAGLDLAASLNSPDPYKLADALRVDKAVLPKNLGAVKADVKASGDVSALVANANVAALGGNVIFKGNVANPMSGVPALSNVALQVKHPNMAKAMGNLGMAAPDLKSLSGPIDLYTNVDMSGKVTSLTGIKATLAGTSMSGNLKYDASNAVPYAAGQLSFGKLVLQSAKGASSTSGGTTQVRPTGDSGKWSTQPIDTAFLRSMNADFDVKAEQLVYETWDMKSPSIKLTLQNGTLNIADLKAGLFDGAIALKGSLAAPAAEGPLAVNMSSNITDINMGSLAKALSGTSRIEAEGDVSLNFDVKGSGKSQNAIVNSLGGKADLTGRKVVMKGFDLAGLATALMDSSKPLDRLQQTLGAATSGGSTEFDTVDGAYTITSGVANIDSMKMDGPAATIVSTGNASLPRWYIDTSHAITLKNAKEVEPFKVAIKGPLDNPTNTFGRGMFDTLLREKVKGQVIEQLPGLLGDKTTSKLQQFGILPQKQAPAAETVTEPAAGTEAAQETQPVQQEQAQPVQQEQQPVDLKEEAIKGLINGLLR